MANIKKLAPVKKEIEEDDEWAVIEWLERRTSVNIVEASESLRLDYQAVMDRIKEQGMLHSELHKLFQKMKYKMIADVQDAVISGEGKLASVSHLKFLIQVIDSGTLLGGTIGSKVMSVEDYQEDSDEFNL